MATDLAVVGNRQLHATLVRNTEERHITRNRVQRTDLDLLTRTNPDLAQAPITQMIGNRAGPEPPS